MQQSSGHSAGGPAHGTLVTARELLKQGRSNDAQILLERLIETDTETAKARHLWALARLEQGDCVTAEQTFRERTRADPGDHSATFSLGLTLERQGRAAEAREQFERTLELKPDFEAAHLKLQGKGHDAGASKPAQSRQDERSRRQRPMNELTIPETEAEVEQFERGLAAKKRAEFWARWHGTPLVIRILYLGFALFVVAFLITVATLMVSSESFDRSVEPPKIRQLSPD